MALVDILIRFGLTMVALMMYITGFGSAVWISTDVDFEDRGKISWGLWVVCDNSTINRRRCPHMSPGDSDAYYEVARTLSCVTLVLYIGLYLGMHIKKHDIDEHLGAWLLFSVLTEAMTVAVLCVVGGYYKTDSRWHNLDPSLGWGFWLVTTAAILLLVVCIAYVVRLCQKRHCECRCRLSCRKKKRPSPLLTSTTAGPSVIGRKRQLQPLKKADHRKVSPVPAPLKKKEQVISGSRSSLSSSPSPPPSNSRDDQQRGITLIRSTSVVQSRPADPSLPLLTLPQYDLPPPPAQRCHLPSAPPPSYHDVINADCDQPPAVSHPDVV